LVVVALLIVALAVVRLSLAVLSLAVLSLAVSGVGKRQRATNTTDEQPGYHEACRRGDTHARSHSVTTSQTIPHTL
jgi:hypothetical protein